MCRRVVDRRTHDHDRRCCRDRGAASVDRHRRESLRTAIATCVRRTLNPKGRSEAAVRVANADLVPTDANLLDDYRSWAELVEACKTYTNEINARVHRMIRRAPGDMLADERTRLHRLPDDAFTAAVGPTRSVSHTSTFSLGGPLLGATQADR